MNKYYLIYILILFAAFKVLKAQAQDKPQVQLTVNHLTEAINSKHEELAPTISGDGKTLFFVRYIGNNKGRQDVWRSTRENVNAPWEKAKKLPEPINNKQHNVVCGTNEDGSKLFLSNAYGVSDTENKFSGMRAGVSVSTCTSCGTSNETWSNPKPVIFDPPMEEKGLAVTGHFFFQYYKHTSNDANNGKEFLLVSLHDLKKEKSEDYRDEEDIFVFHYIPSQDSSQSDRCVLIGDLGKKINTEVYETAPFLLKEGNGFKLFFTRHTEEGHTVDSLYSKEAHLMEAIKKTSNSNVDLMDPDFWKNNWEDTLFFADDESIDILAGDPDGLNSKHFDAYLTFHNVHKNDKKVYGFFASARKSSVKSRNTEEKDVRADIYEFEIDTIPPPTYTLIIKTVDCANKKSLNTEITLTSPGAKSDKKSGSSNYEFSFVGDSKVKGQFKVEASAENYLTVDSSFTMKVDKQNRRYEVELCLKTPSSIPPVSESIFPYLATVYFEFAKFDKFYTYPADTASLLKSENQNDQKKVDQLIQMILDSLKKAENTNKTLVLIGTADYIDIDDLETTRNLDYWSRKRAETVYNYLKKYKITNRIETRFYGDYLKDYKIPSGLSDTLQRAYNRRVVISLLDRDVLDLIDKLSKEGKYDKIDEIIANIREEVEKLKKLKQSGQQ